jgi:ABC-2 type transport system permease protein
VSITAPQRSGSIPTRSNPIWRTSLWVVLRRGLLDRRRGMLVWGLSLGAYGAFMVAIYPSIHHTIHTLIKHYPAGLKEAFGVQTMNTVEGFLHAELFSLIVPLAIAYFMIRAVAGVTVGAEEHGQLDTILGLPISRTVLLTGGYMAAAMTCAAIMAISGIMIFATGRIAGTHISPGLVAAGVMGVWPLAVFAGGVAALAAGALHTSRSVTALALGTVVGMYALDVAGRLAPSVQAFRWASVFRYYGAPIRDGIDPASFIGLTVVGLVLVLLGSILLERRDVLH